MRIYLMRASILLLGPWLCLTASESPPRAPSGLQDPVRLDARPPSTHPAAEASGGAPPFISVSWPGQHDVQAPSISVPWPGQRLPQGAGHRHHDHGHRSNAESPISRPVSSGDVAVLPLENIARLDSDVEHVKRRLERNHMRRLARWGAGSPLSGYGNAPLTRFGNFGAAPAPAAPPPVASPEASAELKAMKKDAADGSRTADSAHRLAAAKKESAKSSVEEAEELMIYTDAARAAEKADRALWEAEHHQHKAAYLVAKTMRDKEAMEDAQEKAKVAEEAAEMAKHEHRRARMEHVEAQRQYEMLSGKEKQGSAYRSATMAGLVILAATMLQVSTWR